MNEHQIRVANVLMAVLIVLLAGLLAWGVYSSVSGRSVTHNDLSARFEMVERQVAYLSCIQLLPELTPEAVADCQLGNQP